MGATGFDPRRGPMRTNQATPTTYKGIPMRSRVEAEYAARLDHFLGKHGMSGAWQYEPMQYADETGTYKPDFVVGDNQMFVEVKSGVIPLGALERMHIVRSTHPTARLIVAVGHWDTNANHYVFEMHAMGCSVHRPCATCGVDGEDTRVTAKARATLAQMRGLVPRSDR